MGRPGLVDTPGPVDRPGPAGRLGLADTQELTYLLAAVKSGDL